jgi:retron-type reverse transcriptase
MVYRDPPPEDLTPPKNRKELFERIASGQKDDVIYDEMTRLGFWSGDRPRPFDPPDELARAAELRNRLSKLRESATALGNLVRLELDLKKQRMAESRKKRELARQKKLAERTAAKAATQEAKKTELRYLGAGVSGGLTRIESDSERLTATKLPVANTALELAAAIGVTLAELRFLAFAREVSTTTHYRRFTIPKRSGGERMISAPMQRLKHVQHWILEHILEPIALADPAHGFVPGRSTVSNAVPHVGAAVVINVDLKDFFPTVTYRRVKGLFAKLGYSEQVATVLGLVCSEPDIVESTLDGVTYYVARGPRRLPQGAPTSPAITNIMCRRLDHRIAGYARSKGLTYTRYADDLTLSTTDASIDVGAVLGFLRRTVAAEGFAVHPDKIRIVRRGRRQEVTGIVVNEKPGVVRAELRRFRALLFQIEKDGPAGKTWGHGGDVLAAALGYASYVQMVDPIKGNGLRERVLALKARYG